MPRIEGLARGTDREDDARSAAGGKRVRLLSTRSKVAWRPGWDRLEDRRLMTGISGYDYLLTGVSWADPQHVTYSIAPDGAFWDHGTNNLNATFNAKFGTDGSWRRQIARALATWQSVANINIAPVSDDGRDFNTLGVAQGDTRFGDIRFGGYAFPGNTTTLAQTYFPPPNGSTAAGDVEVNTSMDFNFGSAYDLFSVLLHETGHSLGLDHPKNPDVVMAANYGGVRTGLTDGDIAGIQAIYGARAPDAFRRLGQGLSFSTAIDLSAGLSATSRLGVSASLTSIGSTETFSFAAPANASGAFQVTAAAAGVSMLSPALSVFDASGKLLARASNPAAWSNNVTVTVAGMAPGQRYFVSVSGATNDVFSVGAYNLVVALPTTSPVTPTTPPATVTSPPDSQGTAVLPDRFEPDNSFATARGLGRITRAVVSGVNLNTAFDVDYFRYQTGLTGAYQVLAPGTLIRIYNTRGRYVAGGADQVNLPSARVGTSFVIRIAARNVSPVESYSVMIAPRTIARTNRRAIRPRHLETFPSASRADRPGNHGLEGHAAVPSIRATITRRSSRGFRFPHDRSGLVTHPLVLPRARPRELGHVATRLSRNGSVDASGA